MSQYLVAIFEQEEPLFGSIKALRSSQVRIQEVYTPYPVHHLDEALGYERTRLPVVAFISGLIGLTLAMTLQIGTMVYDWPLNIGGKNFLSIPTFVPVAFELTVLCAAFGMVKAFLISSNLKPWGQPKLFNIRQTQDQHTMVIELTNQPLSAQDIEKLLQNPISTEIQ